MESGKNQLEPNTYSTKEREQVRDAVREKYAAVSSSAKGMFKYTTGREGALVLGYDEGILSGIPEDLLNSFCGVGNPFSIGEITPGSDILDIGCGTGLDLIVARKITGSEGRVCGIDITFEMIDKARSVFDSLGIDNIETIHVTSETLPFEDNGFDLVISNGAINLSPAKDEFFEEMYRVLRPGGKIQFADIVLEKELPSHLADSLEAWSQ